MDKYWVYMVVLDLIPPFIMIILGKLMKKASKSMRTKIAFRTKMSKKNRNTWRYAHNFCGNFLFNMGGVLMVMALNILILVAERDNLSIGIIAKTMCLLESVAIAIPFAATELALKIKFDSNGNG